MIIPHITLQDMYMIQVYLLSMLEFLMYTSLSLFPIFRFRIVHREGTVWTLNLIRIHVYLLSDLSWNILHVQVTGPGLYQKEF